MNLPPTAINNQIMTQQPPPNAYEPPQNYSSQIQWVNSNGYGSYQLPLQLSQYYNVFPEIPSTKTSWSFPNGCVTSNIVRFTGLPTPSYPVGSNIQSNYYSSCGSVPIKRKSLPVENETQPNKMFITEEKMTARMNGMHISNEFVSHTKPTITETSDDIDEEFQSVPNVSEPKLIFANELKNLNRDLNSIIPESLVPYEKSSNALVIWRPPMSYTNNDEGSEDDDYTPRSSVIITDITDRPNLDNNNIQTVDLNTLTLPSNVEYPPDSMDTMEL